VPAKNLQKNSNSKKAFLAMSNRVTALIRSVEKKAIAHSQTFVRVTFGVFVGSLVVLLILLYANVPIVGM
jgi:hypothetical protein